MGSNDWVLLESQLCSKLKLGFFLNKQQQLKKTWNPQLLFFWGCTILNNEKKPRQNHNYPPNNFVLLYKWRRLKKTWNPQLLFSKHTSELKARHKQKMIPLTRVCRSRPFYYPRRKHWNSWKIVYRSRSSKSQVFENYESFYCYSLYELRFGFVRIQ